MVMLEKILTARKQIDRDMQSSVNYLKAKHKVSKIFALMWIKVVSSFAILT